MDKERYVEMYARFFPLTGGGFQVMVSERPCDIPGIQDFRVKIPVPAMYWDRPELIAELA